MTTKQHNIKISVVDHQDSIDGYETSRAKINLKGPDMNEIISSTLIRATMSLIPVYAFDNEDIKIVTNTSVFDNGEMRCRLANLPVYFGRKYGKEIKKALAKNDDEDKKAHPNIINGDITLEAAPELEYKANIGSAEINLIEESLKERDISNNLSITINVTNKSDNIMNVTTASPGVIFYYKKIQIPHIYDKPLAIIQLRKGEEFVCNMTSSLNIGLYHATYQACAECFHNQISENEFNIILAAKRQLNERDLLIRACKIIIRKAQLTASVIESNIKNHKKKTSTLVNNGVMVEDKPVKKPKKDKDIDLADMSSDDDDDFLTKGELIVEGDQHTMGNLLSYYMKIQDGVKCGYAIGHPNISQFTLNYSCSTNIIDVVKTASLQIITIFTNLYKDLEKIDNFGYKY